MNTQAFAMAIRGFPTLMMEIEVPHLHRPTWLSRSLARHRHDVAERRSGLLRSLGTSRSSILTNAHGPTYSSNDWPPRISVSVLLELARWCACGRLILVVGKAHG